MKTKLFKTFFICLLAFALSSCNKETQQTQTKTEAQNSESQIRQIEELKSQAEEKKFSPDKRLEAFLLFPEPDKPVYRITIVDNEQTKIIFSHEFELTKGDQGNNSGTRSVALEKVLDNFVLLKEFSGEKENLKYLLIQPDANEVRELECKDFAAGFEIIDLTEKTYKCKGLKTNSTQTTEEEFPLPEFKEIAKVQTTEFKLEEKQVKEFENIKVELGPFDTKTGTTPYGQRVNLKVFKDNNLIYEKNFSGKCTGCQWVNQDNFKEAFKIEKVYADKILLTQLLSEENNETMYSSMLIIPSKNKIVHLDCKEQEGEIAYVNEIGEKEYSCKYLNVAKAAKALPLPSTVI